jgi:DnaK suppressor protein
MDDADKERFRAAIDDERRRTARHVESLQRSFTDIVEAADSTSTDDEHDPEGATIAYERSQVTALLHKSTEKLAALDEALRHIDAGGAMRCEVCGTAIVLERLLTLPHVRTCVNCARKNHR